MPRAGLARLMDRASKNLYARVFGSLAQAAFFVHVGQHLMREGEVGAGAWAVVALFLVVAVAASWAQARLNAKRAAVWTALVLLGLLPVGAFLVHLRDLDVPGGYGPVLVLNALFGLATLALTGWILAERRTA